jgi:hypothetical protein
MRRTVRCEIPRAAARRRLLQRAASGGFSCNGILCAIRVDVDGARACRRHNNTARRRSDARQEELSAHDNALRHAHAHELDFRGSRLSRAADSPRLYACWSGYARAVKPLGRLFTQLTICSPAKERIRQADEYIKVFALSPDPFGVSLASDLQMVRARLPTLASLPSLPRQTRSER